MTAADRVFAPNLLNGRVALVTGGGTGIGFGIATCLGRSGAKVAIASRNQDRLEAAVERLRAADIAAIALEANYPPTGALTTVQPALQVEVKAIGPVGFGKILGAVSSVRVVSHYAAVWDIGEK